MRTVRLETPIIWHQLGPLAQDVDYIVEDFTVGQLGELADGKITVGNIPVPERFGDFGNATNICMIFGGGYGDVLMLTPILRNIKKHFPHVSITVCCHKPTHFLLKENTNVAMLMDYPAKERDLTMFQSKIGGVAVSHPGLANGDYIKTTHACDILNMGLPQLEDYKIEYTPRMELVQRLSAVWPKKKKYRVGLQFCSTGAPRNWPLPRIQTMVIALLQAGIEVAYIGYPKQINIAYDGFYQTYQSQILNLSDLGLSMEESAALIYGTCDLVVAPDSFFAHAANGWNKPLVCIMGSFDPAMRRTPGHDLTIYYDGRGACPLAPCFHHGRKQEAWPKDGPCRQTNYCNALEVIEGYPVARKVLEILNKL